MEPSAMAGPRHHRYPQACLTRGASERHAVFSPAMGANDERVDNRSGHLLACQLWTDVLPV